MVQGEKENSLVEISGEEKGPVEALLRKFPLSKYLEKEFRKFFKNYFLDRLHLIIRLKYILNFLKFDSFRSEVWNESGYNSHKNIHIACDILIRT